ncbi:hypothetical protein HGM15179_000363 [Zosterops borbonicus]|uniref:Uncharacterized protein n=1 Tax=Zosterops borbonicus TaxID=364589 RepID=A0A8K1GZ70_9PASS|nr:hypothetical protein HGM15179_000363 [Zosterops borbonicus]
MRTARAQSTKHPCLSTSVSHCSSPANPYQRRVGISPGFSAADAPLAAVLSGDLVVLQVSSGGDESSAADPFRARPVQEASPTNHVVERRGMNSNERGVPAGYRNLPSPLVKAGLFMAQTARVLARLDDFFVHHIVFKEFNPLTMK